VVDERGCVYGEFWLWTGSEVEPTLNPKPSAPPLSPRRGLLMGIDRFEIQSHSHDAGPRRTALRAMGVLGVAGLVSRLGVSSGEAKSKKKGGKRKNRAKTSPACPTCPTSPAPATCPGTCNSGCAQCFLRLGASALCGQSATPNCGMGCSSDSDCVGSDRPYCVTHDYRRTDAQTSNVCPSPGGWCTAVVDCIF
jgi:hypothetical protein